MKGIQSLLMEEMRHTKALSYSRLERLHYFLLGRWPERVVNRRLYAYELDREELRRAILRAT